MVRKAEVELQAEMAAGAPLHVTLSDHQQRGRRVMIIGDVHGCCDELELLLERHSRPTDTLILAGDLVK